MGSGTARLGEIQPWARRDLGEVGWKFFIWTQICRDELKALDWGWMRVCNQDGQRLWGEWTDKAKKISLDFGNDWKLGHLLDGLQSTNGISGNKELRELFQSLWDRRCFVVWTSVIIVPTSIEDISEDEFPRRFRGLVPIFYKADSRAEARNEIPI